jgi:guanylate cyclase
MTGFIEKILSIGADENDSPDLVIWKRVLNGICFGGMLNLPGFALVFWLNDAHYTAIGFLTFAFVIFIMFFVFAKTREIKWSRTVVAGLNIIAPGIYTILMGGILESGLVMIWSMWTPVAAFATGTRASAKRYFYLSLVTIIVTSVAVQFTPTFDSPQQMFSAFVATMNLLSAGLFLFLMMRHFLRQRDDVRKLLAQEQALTLNLLLNVLPESIAQRLQAGETVIADRFEETSILFADMVGFTPLSEKMAAEEVVELLNDLFTRFDKLTEARGVEKIRTIGDAYMAVAGAPKPQDEHAFVMVDLAIAMAKELEVFRLDNQVDINFRIGINSGSVIGAIIGKSKFHYDVWGETVNLAARMESHGIPGRIQITEETFKRLDGKIPCEIRGPIDVKGIGPMETRLVLLKGE